MVGWQKVSFTRRLNSWQVQDYGNLRRWADAIGMRPAVQRGRMVNRVTGELSSQLHERHDASDFNTRTQDKLQVAETES